jgi:CHAD domain-containing protein
MTQDAGNRLISAIQKQNEKTIYFCTAKNISPNIAVHEIRKSFKRIRALLHFFDETNETGITFFKIRVKVFGRELSLLRESFVNLQLFEREMLGNKLIAEQNLKKAREQLADKNQGLIQDIFVASRRCEGINQLLADFNLYLGSPDKLPSKMQLFQPVVLAYEKCCTMYSELSAVQPPGEMHELRKKMKRLWYQFDFLRFMHPRFFRLKTDKLNHISEYMGEDHDLHIFREELQTAELGFDSEEIQILENQILHLRELVLVKLNPRLSQFLQEPQEAFENKMRKIFKLE